MSERIALIADGRLILAGVDGGSKRHDCAFAEEIEGRQQRMAEKNAWKQELGGGMGGMAGGMFPRSALWGQGGGDQAQPRPQIVTVCGGPRPESMIYTLWTGVVGALLEFDFGEGYERRVFHKEQFHASDFDRHPGSGKLICRHGNEQISNLAVLDPDGRNMQAVTEGDSIDGALAPADWVLVKRSASGEESVLAKHVLAYDLGADGRIVFSDGRNVRLVEAGRSRKILTEALTGTVRWL